MKKKSRFSIGYIISALVMLVLGGVVGAYIGTLGELNIAVIVLFVVFLYLSMVLHIIIHEFGHMVFGLLTGYRFLSFRVFNLTLIREDGKLRFKKYTLAGTSGQCLMSPPDFADGKIPVMLYNFGGAFMNLIVSALCFPLFWTFQSSTAPGMFFLVVCLLGVAYAILNGLPMRMGAVNNDGKNAVSLGGNAGALRAWWIQLKLVELTVGGARLRDMPEEWFALPPEEEMGNPLIAYLAVCACSRLMDRHDFAQARELAEKLASGAYSLPSLYLNMLTLDLLFLELTGENRSEVIEKYKTKQFLGFTRAMKNYPAVIRVALAEAFASGNTQDADKRLAQFQKVATTYPYRTDIESEAELIEYARNSGRWI